jgi:outer membrane protein assembly factor BamA
MVTSEAISVFRAQCRFHHIGIIGLKRVRDAVGVVGLAAVLLLAGARPACSQVPEMDHVHDQFRTGAKHSGKKKVDKKAEKKDDKKSGDFVAFPIPIINPTIGNGLAAGAAYLYQLDEKSRVSGTGAGAMYTDSKSWGVAVGSMANFKDDAWKIEGGALYFDLNLEYFGIGSDAGDQGKSIPINENGWGAGVRGLRRIKGHWYVGLQYFYADIQSTFDLSGIGDDPPIPLPPDIELDSSVAALGLIFEYDSRDNQFNAYKGRLLEFIWSEANEAVGSDFNYSSMKLVYNMYFPLHQGDSETDMVLAARGTACATPGDTPFYGLCKFGSAMDLRGYTGGRYRDTTMLTVQAEYRWRFLKKWGVVAFAGVGEVADSFNDYNTDNLLPSAGVGLRFMLSTKNRLNISFDFAVGKDSSAAYFYVAESF